MSRIVAASLFALALGASPALAQEAGADAEANPAELGFMDLDVMLGAGFGNLLYPHLEPSVDVGVLPLGPVTVSVGGVADLGYCLLCAGIDAASEWDVGSWYWSVLAQGLVHFDVLTEATAGSVNVDPYAGLQLGPQFYRFDIGYEPTDEGASFTQTSFLVAPLVGARFFGDGPWFGYVNLRYFFEAGFGEETVTVGGATFTVGDDYARQGFDVSLGAGIRL